MREGDGGGRGIGGGRRKEGGNDNCSKIPTTQTNHTTDIDHTHLLSFASPFTDLISNSDDNHDNNEHYNY